MRAERPLALEVSPRAGGGLAGFTRRAFLAWGRGHARKRVSQDLDGLYLHGLDHLQDALRAGPVILAANHVGWWDGLILVLLNARVGAEALVLMDARQLRRLPWFRAFGCAPLHLDDKAKQRQELDAAARFLSRPGRLLWIFPQGRHTPIDSRPLGLKPGVAQLADSSGAAVVPLSLRFDFIEASAPAASARLGAPITQRPLLPALEAALLDGLEAGRVAALKRAPEGEVLVAPAAPGQAGARAMGWIWRALVGRRQ